MNGHYKPILDTRHGYAAGGIQLFTVDSARTNGFSDLILGTHDSADERTLYVYRYTNGRYRPTECYNVITKETRRLSRLVEDILSVSQLEVGSIELAWGEVDLKTLLSDGVRDVRGLADGKDIDLQLVLPGKTEPVRGDRDNWRWWSIPAG
jgi:signal transduction histidine kinase